MNTDDLIDSLATRLVPVKPLPHPALRAALWLAGAVLYVGILSLSMAKAAGASVSTPALVASLIAALATCALAAVAAFASVVPGYSSRIFAWPAAAAIVWVATLVLGAPQHDGAVAIVEAHHEWICVGLIVVGGGPILGALALMLRRGAPLNPGLTAALGAVAVGTLANVGACLWRPHTDNDLVLVWHGGAIALLVVACVLAARRLLAWPILAASGGR